jgi:hypothetical protein
LTVDGSTLRITCSPAARIHFVTHCRHCQLALDPQGGLITQWEFSLNTWLKKAEGNENAFFRLIVTAPDGTYAVTRGYRKEDLSL